MATGVHAVVRTVRAEWSRFWSVRSSPLLVSVIGVGALGVAALAASQSAASAPAGGSPWILAGFIGLPILFGVLILLSIASTADYTTGSIVTTLQWSPRRGLLFLCRVIVLGGLGLVVGLAMVTAAATLLWVSVPQLTFFSADDWRQVGAAALVFSCSALLAVGVGLSTRNVAATLSITFGLVLVLPLLLQIVPFAWINQVIELLPGAAALHFLLGEGPGETAMTDLNAAAVLVGWSGSALTVGGARFLRADAAR